MATSQPRPCPPPPVIPMPDAMLAARADSRLPAAEQAARAMLYSLYCACMLDDTALILNVGFELDAGRLTVSFRRREIGHWSSCGQRLAWHSTSSEFCLAQSAGQALAYTIHVLMNELSRERGGTRERRKPRML